MAKPTLETNCVRVILKDGNGQQLGQGSGVIIKVDNNYFVLTANHCVSTGDKPADPVAEIANIWVERQRQFNSPFERIKVLRVVGGDSSDDWALLGVENPNIAAGLFDTLLGENIVPGENVFFRGYQSFNPKQPRSWDAGIIDVSSGDFKITLNKGTLNQGGELGADLAKGLSGSGVFIMRNEKLFLVGHLKSVVGEIALNDDINCCSVGVLREVLKIQFKDLKAAENQSWENDTRNLNDVLIQKVFTALREHNDNINRVGIGMDTNPEKWEQPGTKDKIFEITAKSYIGVLGTQITKLIAIGKGDKSNPQYNRDYIQQAIDTAKRSLQLLDFIFLSKLWDTCQQERIQLEPDSAKLITDFFDSYFEPSMNDYLQILTVLIRLYKTESRLVSPIEELDKLFEQCQPDSDFRRAIGQLVEIEARLIRSGLTPTDCFDAEAQLATVLETLAFLSRYGMISIKNVGYHQVRNKKGRYQHWYAELYRNNGAKTSRDAERINYVANPVNTDTVVFYSKDYETGLNLSPFIIDLNAMGSEAGHKVYFYSSRNLERLDELTYSFLEDNSRENIGFENLPEDMPGIIDVLRDPLRYTQFRKDTVHRLFMEARKAILELS